MRFICQKRKSAEKEAATRDKSFTFSDILPQIAATVFVSLLHIPLGFTFAFSAVLIPQLEKCDGVNENCSDGIFVTDTDKSWIASLITIFIPIGGIIGGFMLDSFGRLTVLRLSAVPGVIGWILLATASNIPMLLVGRILNGFSLAWVLGGTFVYVSEISTPHIRGSMITIPPTIGSLGICLMYALGYLLHWRIIAWIAVVCYLLFTLLTMFLPKSPVWLVSKKRIEEAKVSLKWLNKRHVDAVHESNRQLDILIERHCAKEESSLTSMRRSTMLFNPSVYKPILILIPFHFFVQFSGLYIIIFYTVSLFNDMGTNIDPFIASIGFGVVRFVTALANIGLMQRYGRRQLMIASGLIMSISIGVSGLYTKWILEGSSTNTWVPTIMVAIYVLGTMIGFLPIPLAVPSELFPTAMRGLGQSVSISILYGLGFAATRSYYDLNEVLGGSPGLQFFFAVMSLGGAVYTYIFLPETQKKDLHEIEDYFKYNSIYLLYVMRSKKKASINKIVS